MTSPTIRFGAVAAALAMLLATFLAIGPLSASPAAAASSTILANPTATDLVKHSDTSGVEVGTKFTALSDGTATAMRFWKNQDTVTSHGGSLWTSSGTKLAKATFANETASGWQTAQFDQPVALKAGQTYVVSYYAPRGQYAVTYEFDGQSQSADLKIADGSGLFSYGSTSKLPTTSWRNSTYWVDVVFEPAPKPAPAPDPAPAPEPEPAPAPPATGFPSAATTGVPAGTTLSTYTGPCRITTPNTVIDAKTVNCADLRIETTGVTITKSIINGKVYTDEHGIGAFTITDSEVRAGNWEGTGIGDARFTATRVEVSGGSRSVNCFLSCTIQDSYVHGQFTDTTGRAHESGIRMGSNAVIRHNTIACDAPDVAPDAGCSAALTGYGDFWAVKNNTIDGNLFVAGSGGYCTYGGSTAGKPYSSETRDIRFTNNVWERGESGQCGFWGPITSFDSNAPGNVWSNNTYDDGTVVRPAN
ncbi:MAG: DUF4082 domain-containing protein [Mycetocola sp.]